MNENLNPTDIMEKAKIEWPDAVTESLFFENANTCYEYPINFISF